MPTEPLIRNTRTAQKARAHEEFTLLDPSGNSTPAIPPASPAPMSSAQPSSAHNDPVDNEAEASSLAKAINNLVKSNSSSAKPKLREPDPFDGSDPKKLRTFILQCKLNFRDRKDLFGDDETKVNYALSYLKGAALDCFEPALLDPIDPAWLSEFDLFIEELETNFGSFDPEGEAEAELEQLRMQENHQATKYFIKFQQLAARVKWGDAALRRQAYNGLAKRIKNDMVHHHKPNSLQGLRVLAQLIDSRYWERRAEISRENGTSGSSGNKSEHQSDSSKSDSKSGKGSSHSKQKNNSGSKGSTSDQKKPDPDLSSKLGKDGKLTPQERQRRLDNNLCLFCGTSGHVAKDCPKSSSASSKARASKTEQDKSASSGSDSKKD